VLSRLSRVHDASGQVTLLIIAYMIISLCFVLTAIDAAEVFLAQRALANLADGAALSGAQAVDRSALYAGTAGCRLPLSPSGAVAAVEGYFATGGLPAGYGDVLPAGVTVDPASDTVTVTLVHRVRLPLQGILGGIVSQWAGGVPLTVSASARSPLISAGGAAGC